MKKWITRILIAVLVIGAFAVVGFGGYRLGFNQGAQVSSNFENAPRFAQPFPRDEMPGRMFGSQHRGFLNGEYQMTHRGRGFGLIPPFFGLIKIALLSLVLWLAYMLFKGNGWTLSLTRVAAPQTPPEAKPAEAPSPKRTGKGKQ